jgi:hypothetical protein
MAHELLWKLTTGQHYLQQCGYFTFHEIAVGNGSTIKVKDRLADNFANIYADGHRYLLIFIMESLYGMTTSALTPDSLSEEFYYNVDGLHVERSS